MTRTMTLVLARVNEWLPCDFYNHLALIRKKLPVRKCGFEPHFSNIYNVRNKSVCLLACYFGTRHMKNSAMPTHVCSKSLYKKCECFNVLWKEVSWKSLEFCIYTKAFVLMMSAESFAFFKKGGNRLNIHLWFSAHVISLQLRHTKRWTVRL